MPYNTNSLVQHTVESPNWMPDGRMWYRDTGKEGNTFYVVDPVAGKKQKAFDQDKLAAALTPFNKSAKPIDPYHLPIYDFSLTNNDQTVVLGAYGQRLSCDLSAAGVCTALDKVPPTVTHGRRRTLGGEELSPDGHKAAFIRDWNLWMRDTATGREVQLTTDGVVNYGYATDNAGWTHSDNPILVWSPDSRRIATFQQDQRKTGEMYLTNVTYGHPHADRVEIPAGRRQGCDDDRARRH